MISAFRWHKKNHHLLKWVISRVSQSLINRSEKLKNLTNLIFTPTQKLNKHLSVTIIGFKIKENQCITCTSYELNLL